MLTKKECEHAYEVLISTMDQQLQTLKKKLEAEKFKEEQQRLKQIQVSHFFFLNYQLPPLNIFIPHLIS